MFQVETPVRKFDPHTEAYREGVEISGFEVYEVGRSPLRTRKSRKRMETGRVGLEEDAQIRKLDLLINRINNRLKVSSKLLSA